MRKFDNIDFINEWVNRYFDEQSKFVTGKEIISDIEYHWAGWKLDMIPSYIDIGEITEWCIETFNSNESRYFFENNKFYFKNIEDAVMFAMRWS